MTRPAATDVLEVEERFATLPEWLLRAPVSARAKVLYAILQRFGNTAGVRMPSQQELAVWLHCSEPSVSRASAELEQLGAVRILRTKKPKANDQPGIFVTRNTYLLMTSNPRSARHSPVKDASCTGESSVVHQCMQPIGKELKKPPPTPKTGEAVEGIDVPELAAEIRVLRRELGLPTARWTTRNIRRAITAALDAGYEPQHCPDALRAVATDVATQTAGRLAHDGPWWTAAETDELRQQRRRQRDAQRRADQELVANCRRCDPAGWMQTMHGRARCDHILDVEDTA